MIFKVIYHPLELKIQTIKSPWEAKSKFSKASAGPQRMQYRDQPESKKKKKTKKKVF